MKVTYYLDNFHYFSEINLSDYIVNERYEGGWANYFAFI